MTNIILPDLGAFSPSKWTGQAIPEREWLVPHLIPMRNVTMIMGDGATGKTLLALQLQGSASIARPWAGFQVEPVKSLGIYCEDDESELHRRVASIAESLDCKLNDLECMSLVSRAGMDNLLVEFDKHDVARPTALYDGIAARAKEIGARLVVLDSLHDLFGGNEINRVHARQFIARLHRIALDIDGAVRPVIRHQFPPARKPARCRAGANCRRP
jgi:RecA-family ATPase